MKKNVLKNFVKLTRNTCARVSLFNNVAGLIEKGTLAHVFLCEFYEIFKTTIFAEHFRETAFDILLFLIF